MVKKKLNTFFYKMSGATLLYQINGYTEIRFSFLLNNIIPWKRKVLTTLYIYDYWNIKKLYLPKFLGKLLLQSFDLSRSIHKNNRNEQFFYLIKHTMRRCYRWNMSNRLLSESKSKSLLTSIQGIIILLYPPVISICRGLFSASFTHVYKFFYWKLIIWQFKI